MARLLLINPEPTLDRALHDDVKLRGHLIERCGGHVEAIHRARDRAVDVVITSPIATFSEDLAFAKELQVVLPGARLTVSIWADGDGAARFQTTDDDGQVVIDHGEVTYS